MSTKAKWEQLIEKYLHEDQERAEQLFHEIVVESSRKIYEELMELDGDDQVGQFIDEVSSEETQEYYEADEGDDSESDELGVDADMPDADMPDADMSSDEDMPSDEDEDEFGDEEEESEFDVEDEEDEDDAPATKSDIMNLEDKLDELMAEFESKMHDSGSSVPDEEDEESSDDEDEDVMESIQLPHAPKPKHEDHKATSPVAANAGSKGPVGSVVKPVATGRGAESVPTGPKSPSNAYTKGQGNLPGAGSFKNTVNGAGRVAAGHGDSAPRPKTETVKAKSPVPESRKNTKKRI